MFDFQVIGDTTSLIKPATKAATATAANEVWSATTLQPLAPGRLTPFSFSVLAEIMSRAWYQYYESLGFAPKPRTKVVRQHSGMAYFSLTKSARLEAEHAGVAPIMLRINDTNVTVCPWEKPGILGSLRYARAQKRQAETIAAFDAQYPETLTKARNWYIKTGQLKWTQADILQVMEEIERVSLPSFMAYLAARQQLEAVYNQLIRLTVKQSPYPENLNLINHAVSDLQGLIETKLADELVKLSEEHEVTPAQMAWLKAGNHAEWQTMLPAALVDALAQFMNRYGHRAAGEGEMANPRWNDDPAPLLAALHTYWVKGTRHPAALPAETHVNKLADVADGQAKQIAALVEKAREALLLQSKALNAIAYILAGTRRWALAAGREAMSDQRLDDPGDVFYYELEEIKQMMTGEWNVSALQDIRATAVDRKAAYAEADAGAAAELLIGDVEARATADFLPATKGHAQGPWRRSRQPRPLLCNGAVIGTTLMDSGWSILLPIAQGIVTASGTPLDPVVAAGRIWHTPILVSAGPRYATLVDGAQTNVDVDQLLLNQ